MNTQRLTVFTQKLIQTPSLSGDEHAVVQLILQEMRSLGFDRLLTDENGSAIGIIQGKHPGPTLLLDAHCDTVPISGEDKWSHPPFAAEIKNDTLYGRGAADMKGALAAMVHAAASVNKNDLRGRIVVSATVLEEVMEGVSLKTVTNITQPDFVIIGESTEFRVNVGGRGRAEIHLETIGKPAHSSSPQLGVNAVHLMQPVISAMESLPRPSHPLLGDGILTLTDIISAPYPGQSVVPSSCRVTYDRRLLPGETATELLETIISQPAIQGTPINIRLAHGEHTAYTGVTLRGDKFFPAWMMDENHPLVQNGLKGIRQAGITPQIGTYRFCTNAAYSAGIAHIPTIGFGPGAEGDAHVIDEQIKLEDLYTAARGYKGMIEAILG